MSTTDADANGCRITTVPLGGAITIDNNLNDYALEVKMGVDAGCGINGCVKIVAARIGYKLQISPAPGAATFSDVPLGAPGFQEVEALAASGISLGCGGGNFCPDDPVTRRNMARFLARALGLHWPN